MITTQRLPAALTPLESALVALLDDLKPVAPREVALAEALGCVAADMPPLAMKVRQPARFRQDAVRPAVPAVNDRGRDSNL